eukprot:599867-Pyramimonas_sp.AAC.1
MHPIERLALALFAGRRNPILTVLDIKIGAQLPQTRTPRTPYCRTEPYLSPPPPYRKGRPNRRELRPSKLNQREDRDSPHLTHQ